MRLSEAKRRVRVGTVIDVTGYYNPAATGARTVVEVLQSGFFFDNAQIKRGWCPWPKARLTRSLGANSILLLRADGSPMSRLVIRDAAR